MKSLLKWLVKKFIGKDEIKSAIHALNEELARREVGDTAAKVMDVSDDAAALLGVYLKGYANDGRIDETELAAVNAECDRVVDKYITDEAVAAALDKVLG